MFGHRREERDAAFTAFMASSSASLTRTAWLLTGNADAAQELVQAALVKTYVAWPRVREGQAQAYARKVLVNHHTETWRKGRRESVMAEVPDRPTGQVEDRSATAGSDQRDQIVRLLAQLPPQQRQVVVLRYYADQSEQAVAEQLGISIGAVKSAASRGLAALRALTSGAAAPDQISTREGASS